MKKQTVCLIVLLLAGSFLLRFAGLSSNPPGFFRDEADKGYTSYCLLQAGQDQSGRSWPLFVQAMKVTTSAVYQYVDLPFIAALGLTEQAVRLPACLAGVLSVCASFLLARSLWGTAAGLWAGLFVALSPWSLLLSRWANQSILLTFSIPLGIYLFVRQKERPFPSIHHSWAASCCFLLALYTYAPARMYIPVFCVLIWLASLSRVSLSREHRRSFFLSGSIFFTVFAVGCIPLAHHLLYESAESGARLSQITIHDGQSLFSMIREWIGNYFLHFSPGFLWIRGDENLRHSTALFGQLHIYLIPLILMGLVRALKTRSRIDRILLIWLFMFPIASAFTRESIPHALRSVFAVPAFHVTAAYGLTAWREWRPCLEKRFSVDGVKAAVRLWTAALILLPAIHLYDLFFQYPRYAAMDWEYGYKEAVEWWKTHRAEADSALVSGLAEYPYVFFLFYDEYPPEQWIARQRIDGVEFVPTGRPTQSVLNPEEGRVLYLLRPDELQMAMPDAVIQLPTGEAIWKWVAWGKRRE
ncbi:MAG: glycosyltransferase family 39 protein [Candidatus Omnitrophica bacterium]|nr:glycosyltransferase family 39 protein [Candidatus Omnitrophota bacterium]